MVRLMKLRLGKEKGMVNTLLDEKWSYQCVISRLEEKQLDLR